MSEKNNNDNEPEFEELVNKEYGNKFENKKNSIFNNYEENKENVHQKNESNKILDLAKKYCLDLFVDQYQEPYALVEINNHFEILGLKSYKIEKWLYNLYYQHCGIIPSSESVRNTIKGLESQTIFEDNTQILNLRIGKYKNIWYYDLTNYEWEITEISKNGWNIKKIGLNTKILFKRYNNQISQVYPSGDYPPDIFDKFMELLNIKDKENKLLLKCYIVSMFIPDIPKPILMLYGEQGSAKSTLMELIKMLVDPSRLKTLTFPRDINELVQVLSHNYIGYFDNISEIKDWISDQLCRCVTGSGFSKRQLFTDDDSILYEFMRCIGFNGINLGSSKADLLDRGILVELERIPDEDRKKIQEIWNEFERIKPYLLAYILDVLVKVIQFRESNQKIDIRKFPRMADFAEYGEIISRCMGYKENEFLNVYYKNIGLQTQQAIDANIIASVLVSFMEERTEWIGKVSELLNELNKKAEDEKINTNSMSWSKSSNVLSRKLNQIKTTLRSIGILIERQEDTKKHLTLVVIRKIPPVSPSSPETENQTQNCIENNGDTKEVVINNKIPPDALDEIRACQDNSGDIGDTGDDLHIDDIEVRNPAFENNNFKLEDGEKS